MYVKERLKKDTKQVFLCHLRVIDEVRQLHQCNKSRKSRKMLCIYEEKVDIGYKGSLSPPFKRVINEEARQLQKCDVRKF